MDESKLQDLTFSIKEKLVRLKPKEYGSVTLSKFLSKPVN